MSEGRIRWEERMSGGILTAVFGVQCVPIDHAYIGNGIVDLALRATDGTVHAIEVTRYEDQKYVAWSKFIASETWSIPGLEFGWHLSIEPTRKIKGLKKKVGPLLRGLENLNTHALSTRYCQSDHGRSLSELGVASAMVLRSQVPGLVQLGEGARGSFISIDAVSNVIRNEGIRGNSTKLLDAVADVRHLMVWVGYSQLAESLGFGEPGLPEECPDLPLGIDRVWLVSPTSPLRVITYDRNGWAELFPDLEVVDESALGSDPGLWGHLYPSRPRRARRH